MTEPLTPERLARALETGHADDMLRGLAAATEVGGLPGFALETQVEGDRMMGRVHLLELLGEAGIDVDTSWTEMFDRLSPEARLRAAEIIDQFGLL